METKIQTAVSACQLGDIQTLQFLLNGHVTANELDREGCGLLHWASINSHVNIIQLLLSHDANINMIGGYMQSTPLHWACYNARLEAVVALVKNGADPTIKNVNGETPLHLAACTSNFTIVAYLMVKFPYIKDVRDKLGRSALMLAADKSFGLFPIRIFTKLDAYLDFTSDDTGDTALHVSMFRQNLKGAVELVYEGADDMKKNKKGKTPYDLADEKFVKFVTERVETRRIRETGTLCQKATSRWFLMQLFTGSITGILMCGGLGLYYLTNFWVVLSVIIISFPLTIFLLRKKQMENLGYFPVTYICWMGMAELAILIFDSEGLIHWSVLMTLCSVWVASVSLYWILILTDPGVLHPPSSPLKHFIEEVEEKNIERFCFTCWIPKTPNSHHCSQCDKCVDEFDHHCPWIHKCVYRKNIRFFVLFCLTNFLFDLMYAMVLVYMISISLGNVGFHQTLYDHGIMVISLLFAIPHVLGAASITFTQLSQISRHVTTIEIIRYGRAQQIANRVGSDRSASSPYQSPWENRSGMKVRIRNVWNLLLFDKFEVEQGEQHTDSETTFSETTSMDS